MARMLLQERCIENLNELMMVDDKTKIIGLIAIKPGRLDSAMWNSAFEHLGLNFIHLSFTVVNLKDAITGIRALNFRGCAVSMPYKQKVMKYLDKIDPIAKKIGAVNTIANNKGFLTGYNSDWIGATEALREVCELKDKRAVLIGAGGAARAIAYGLRKNRSNVVVFNRTPKKAKNLAEEFDLEFGGGLENIQEVGDYDILINATSVGFYPDVNRSVVEETALKKNKIVMDIVFDPLETQLLKLAKNKNCKLIPGYKMLIYQALFQFKLWTGQKAPFRILEETVLNILK